MTAVELASALLEDLEPDSDPDDFDPKADLDALLLSRESKYPDIKVEVDVGHWSIYRLKTIDNEVIKNFIGWIYYDDASDAPDMHPDTLAAWRKIPWIAMGISPDDLSKAVGTFHDAVDWIVELERKKEDAHARWLADQVNRI